MAIRTFVAFSCVHRPIHDADYCDWLIDAIAERQPDVVVNLGDTIDIECLSRYERVGRYTLQDEYDSTSLFVNRLNDAVRPDATLVWCEGNHEERARRMEQRDIAALIDYRRHVDGVARWKHVPYVMHPDDGTYRVGQVVFAHGFTASKHATKREAIRMTRALSNNLYVFGHTHRPFDVHQILWGTEALPFWHVNTGCGIDFGKVKQSYMQTKDDSQWGQGYVHGWSDTKRSVDTRRNWGAELVMRRMAWGG
jgi:predicted phosphodiesterase